LSRIAREGESDDIAKAMVNSVKRD
jgi:hypothetical protein